MFTSLHKDAGRLALAMRVTDVLALVCAGELAGWIYFKSALIGAPPVHLVVLYIYCGLAFFLFPQFGVYRAQTHRSLVEDLRRLAPAWSTVLLLGIFVNHLLRHIGDVARPWMLCWLGTGLLLLLGTRSLAYGTLVYLRKKGWNSKKVLLVGYGPIGREMHRRALQENWCAYQVTAILHEPADSASAERRGDGRDDALTGGLAELAGLLAGTPAIVRLGSLPDIPSFLATQQIDEIWIALPIGASAQLRELQYLLRNALVDIRWVPDTASMHILSSRMVDFLGFPSVELNRPDSYDIQGIAKEAFDRLFAIAALLLLAPLFAVLALAIKCASPGPVLFRQQRLGLNGRPFTVYKFRTMHVHQAGPTLEQASRDDPRVMKLGGFMRRCSLDELPQFYNVLIGDMSVVGPRPHALPHNELYRDLLESYMLRHRVKPGITGWAQMHGFRGRTETLEKMAARVKFDLDYIQRWSLWMDLRIIAWTAFRGWRGEQAF